MSFVTGMGLLVAFLVLSLSLWILIPAPVFSLLPLSVATPEISPGLLLLNGLIGVSSFALLHGFPVRSVLQGRWGWGLLACSTLAFVISALPLSQLPSTQRAADQALHQALGTDYWEQIDPEVRGQLRSQPFNFIDTFRGLPIPATREILAIPFANPEGVSLTLNLYLPEAAGTYPGLINIYGGAWQRGSPEEDAQFHRYMAAQGYAVWAISYRHAPAYQFPNQLEDVQAAIAFIQTHAKDYETDINRMAVLGRSAGAQLASLAAYGASPVPLRGVVNYYGPVNLTYGYHNVPTPDPIQSRPTLETFLGGTPDEVPALYAQASPINSVKPGLPPSLLFYGKRDNIVQARYGKVLAQALERDRNPVALITIPWADHAFDAIFQGISNQLALYYTERFLARVLHPVSSEEGGMQGP